MNPAFFSYAAHTISVELLRSLFHFTAVSHNILKKISEKMGFVTFSEN